MITLVEKAKIMSIFDKWLKVNNIISSIKSYIDFEEMIININGSDKND